MFKSVLKKRESNDSEISIFAFLMLTLTGGFLDAYTYLLRGGVFANAQTGNLVLFGVNLYLNGVKAFHYLFPVFSFIAGILISWFLKDHLKGYKGFDWRTVILLAEFLVVIVIGFVDPKPEYNDIVNISVSFITALQYGAFRKIINKPFATTMCTGMLRSATDHIYKYIKLKDRMDINAAVLYFLVVCVFISGSLLGGMAVKYMSAKSIWLCDIIFLAVIFMVYSSNCKYFRKRRKGEENETA